MDRPKLVDQADAVVIGAGAFGFATAYQLTKLGVGNVVLIDQYEPGTQVSPKAAGLFRCLQASEVKTRLSELAIRIVSEFEAESGVAMPHVRSGSILAARTVEHTGMIDAEAEDGRGWGVEVQMIDGPEAERMAPFLDGSTIRAAYFVPGDVYIEEPKSMLMAYRQAGERLGMQVIGHTPVTGIRVENGEVRAVHTPAGDIRTPIVVDAAGPWARNVGRMVGRDVRVVPMRHQLRITAPIAGITPDLPIVRIPDSSGYVRPARGGLMVGGMEPGPFAVPELAPGFTMDMVPLDLSVTQRFVDSLAPTISALQSATSQEERGGLFTMTADSKVMAGPVAGVNGFWVATGCNGSGFSLSSGVGRCIAEWIVGGESSIDLSALDPNRFAGSALTDDELVATCAFQYSNYYTPSLR